MLEFINLQKRNMNVKEYALRFTQLAKYAASIVSISRTKDDQVRFGLCPNW